MEITYLFCLNLKKIIIVSLYNNNNKNSPHVSLNMIVDIKIENDKKNYLNYAGIAN